MLIKFNPSIAGYTNASIGTNKNISFKKNPAVATVEEMFRHLDGLNPKQTGGFTRFISRCVRPALNNGREQEIRDLAVRARQEDKWFATPLERLFEN